MIAFLLQEAISYRSEVARDYIGVTTLHPLAMGAIVILSIAVLLLSRVNVIVPFLILACFISPAQRVVVFGLNFNLMRILVLVGWFRVAMRGEYKSLNWIVTDTLIALYVISSVLVYTIREADVSALIYRIGAMYDVVGVYFLARCLVCEWSDVYRIVMALCAIAVPVAALFLIEKATQRNLFAIFGGVPEITWVREGRLRCQGAYAHSIIAGCFWAAVMPLMAAQVFRGGTNCWLGLIGLGSSLVIVGCCSSSTPVSGVILGAFGMMMFLMRRWMGWVCIGTVIVLCVLHMLMKMPVWHLLARIDFVGGSTGYHRYQLMDQAIRRFNEWALIGTSSTSHWGEGLFDITNQYVLEGVRGGGVTLLIMLAFVVASYLSVGRLWRRESESMTGQLVAWSLGVGLFVHTTSFLAISYFGLQIDLVWYLNLALIASLVSLPRAKPGTKRGEWRQSGSPAGKHGWERKGAGA